jgi:hypothetical protein
MVIYQGSSLELKVVINDDQKNPIDLSVDAESVCLMQVFDANDNVIARFRNPSTDGYNDIELLAPASGEYIVRLEADKTKKAAPGMAYMEVKISLSNEAFDANLFHSITKTDLFEIEKSKLKDVS